MVLPLAIFADFLPMTICSMLMGCISKTVPIDVLLFNGLRYLSLGIIVFVVLLFKPELMKTIFKLKPIYLAGCVTAGILLFAVTYIYVRMLRKYGIAITTVFSNALAILAGSLVGVILFREKLVVKEYIGIAFVIIGIILTSSHKKET